MKSVCTYIGFFIGMFIGAITEVSGIAVVCCIIGALIGRAIGASIEEEQYNEKRRKEEYEFKQRLAENERARKAARKAEAQALARKYPEATKYYFKYHWNITKSYISDYDITDDKVDTLLGHKYSYEQEEQRRNTAYRLKIEAEKEAKRKAEREAAERKRREEERERQRKEAEFRNLAYTLPSCVASWNSHSNSTLKHKYFYEYYPYNVYKDSASYCMKKTWKTVWNFKNDPSKNISYSEHASALDTVVELVENTLRSTFGSKVEHLTLVCLTASTQRKTELRFKEFSERVCRDLHMTNAFSYIKVVGDGGAKHEGGSGVVSKEYNNYFFRDKYIVLFDDVRTSGESIERERNILERFGSKVICAITIAQTTH